MLRYLLSYEIILSYCQTHPMVIYIYPTAYSDGVATANRLGVRVNYISNVLPA